MCNAKRPYLLCPRKHHHGSGVRYGRFRSDRGAVAFCDSNPAHGISYGYEKSSGCESGYQQKRNPERNLDFSHHRRF